MWEFWPDAPEWFLRIGKHILGPTGGVGFVLAVPLLWLVPARHFASALLAASLLVPLLTWGPTFLLGLSAALAPLMPAMMHPTPGRKVFGLAAAAGLYLAAFALPWGDLPVLAEFRAAGVWPGLAAAPEAVLYSGLAFTALRVLHLLSRRDDGLCPGFGNVLLYLLFAPTFRMGPFQTFEQFLENLTGARSRITVRDTLIGLGQVAAAYGVLLAVIHVLDRRVYRPLGYPDDGSFLYHDFFLRPPESGWLTLGLAMLWTCRLAMLVTAFTLLAHGLGRMVGFRLPANMHRPMLAATLPEWWRRYHMSVGGWVRGHVFDPVRARAGGFAACLAGFVVIGLWHHPGWGPLAWGAGQAVGLWAWRRAVPDRDAAEPPGFSWTRLLRTGSGIAAVQLFLALTFPLLFGRNGGEWAFYRGLLSARWW
jgi:D-alanyl-lipoteichoic acid acyltransferase DltB (MBOAT superfamily)